jgi:hypothetical protein
MRRVIGVDIGQSGAIVVVEDGRILAKYPMPVFDGRTDSRKFAAILAKNRTDNCHVVMEKFAGFFGYAKSGACSISRQLGNIESIVELLKIPYTQVIPRVWQKEMWVGTKDYSKKSKGKDIRDTKRISLIAARKLAPDEKFLMTKRSTKPHDGLVDAFLMAMYGYRKGL